METLFSKAARVIRDIFYINIASITPEGKPWNTPVYSAHDRDLNIYWLSWKENQHSINIRQNPSVFVTMYDSTVPISTGFGVYMEGKAYELKHITDILKGIKEIYGREKRTPRDVVQFLAHFPRRVYRFVPERVWVNGEGEIEGNFIDIRTELSLSDLRHELQKTAL